MECDSEPHTHTPWLVSPKPPSIRDSHCVLFSKSSPWFPFIPEKVPGSRQGQKPCRRFPAQVSKTGVERWARGEAPGKAGLDTVSHSFGGLMRTQEEKAGGSSVHMPCLHPASYSCRSLGKWQDEEDEEGHQEDQEGLMCQPRSLGPGRLQRESRQAVLLAAPLPTPPVLSSLLTIPQQVAGALVWHYPDFPFAFMVMKLPQQKQHCWSLVVLTWPCWCCLCSTGALLPTPRPATPASFEQPMFDCSFGCPFLGAQQPVHPLTTPDSFPPWWSLVRSSLQ